jgi:hypothetical protein
MDQNKHTPRAARGCEIREKAGVSVRGNEKVVFDYHQTELVYKLTSLHEKWRVDGDIGERYEGKR